jgi:hypothetical protein
MKVLRLIGIVVSLAAAAMLAGCQPDSAPESTPEQAGYNAPSGGGSSTTPPGPGGGASAGSNAPAPPGPGK